MKEGRNERTGCLVSLCMAGVLGLGSSLRGLKERETRKGIGCRVLDGGPICMFSSEVVGVAYLRMP